MKTFTDVAEAFNYYKDCEADVLDKRAEAIKKEIESNAEVDVRSLNIELTGIKEAKENLADKKKEYRGDNMNVITGTKTEAKKPFEGAAVDSPEYRNAFLKSLMGQQLTEDESKAYKAVVEQRNDSFNTSSNSGAVLPTATLNEVIKKAGTMGGLLGEVRHFAMPTGISIPVGTPSSKAAWHTEAAAVDRESITTAAVTFGGYEIMKVFSISVKVKTMSISAFEAYLVDELTACVMECIEEALIKGTGSGQGTGLASGITWVKTAGATQNNIEVAANKSIGYSDVVALVALLKRGYAQGAKFACNNATLYNTFYGMVDSNGRPIFIADPKNESIGRILGHEVIVDDYVDDNEVYFGNYSKYMGYNLPMGITIESSRESGFTMGVIDYRAMAIADCKPIVTEAFVKLSKASE